MNIIVDEANNAYYNEDTPILSDDEFNLLSDNGLEISNFRVKAKHYQPCGSLSKIKEESEFNKWVKGNVVFVTPKLDGNSIELIYDNGELVKAITRGDGYWGNDVTDKIIHCNYPKGYKNGSVKCEAIMSKHYQNDYPKNIRNVVAGLINKKEPVIQELNRIDIIPFESLNPFVMEVYNETYLTLNDYYDRLKKEYQYEIDGLVISLNGQIYPELDDLLPTNTIALKFNKSGLEAKIGSIEWQLGKHGRLTPVLILESPVEIGGSTINRISASNYGIVKTVGLGIGAVVEVIKSGDIIPIVKNVITPSFDFEIKTCPNCYGNITISDNGIHAICNHCKQYDKLIKLKHIFKILDLEFINDSTIESLYNNGYHSLTSIFCLTEKAIIEIDGFGSKKAKNIISKLSNCKLTEAQVLECAMVQGLGNKQCQKLIDHFGSLDNFLSDCTYDKLIGIGGFGEVLSSSIMDNLNVFKEIYNGIIKCGIEIIKKGKIDNKGKVAVTGKWKIGRKEIIDKLENMGYTFQSSVTKDTDILLVEDESSNSGKLKKAKDSGIKIISYDNFFER